MITDVVLEGELHFGPERHQRERGEEVHVVRVVHSVLVAFTSKDYSCASSHHGKGAVPWRACVRVYSYVYRRQQAAKRYVRGERVQSKSTSTLRVPSRYPKRPTSRRKSAVSLEKDADAAAAVCDPDPDGDGEEGAGEEGASSRSSQTVPPSAM